MTRISLPFLAALLGGCALDLPGLDLDLDLGPGEPLGRLSGNIYGELFDEPAFVDLDEDPDEGRVALRVRADSSAEHGLRALDFEQYIDPAQAFRTDNSLWDSSFELQTAEPQRSEPHLLSSLRVTLDPDGTRLVRMFAGNGPGIGDEPDGLGMTATFRLEADANVVLPLELPEGEEEAEDEADGE